jgi:hypothetical protein
MQVNEYCTKGVYASDSGDVIGNALCQVFKVNYTVAQLDGNGNDLQRRKLVPLRERLVDLKLPTVTMVRWNNHYDALCSVEDRTNSINSPTKRVFKTENKKR